MRTGRTRLLLAGALFTAAALIVADYQGSSPLVRGLRSATGTIVGGAERLLSPVTTPLANLLGAGGSSGQVAALQRQVIGLRAKLSAAKLDKAQYAQLSKLLGLAGAGGYKVVPASVVAVGQGAQQTVTLDAGSAAGVRPQETVLDAGGLVGQVVSVTPATSTVLLATDASSVIGVRVAPSGLIGWVTGAGPSRSGELNLKVLSSGAALKPGEQLVTAASEQDKPFVPGVPIGVVTAVQSSAGTLTAQALVRPYADFSALDVVGVVTGPPSRSPGYSLLPHPSAAGQNSQGGAARALSGLGIFISRPPGGR